MKAHIRVRDYTREAMISFPSIAFGPELTLLGKSRHERMFTTILSRHTEKIASEYVCISFFQRFEGRFGFDGKKQGLGRVSYFRRFSNINADLNVSLEMLNL